MKVLIKIFIISAVYTASAVSSLMAEYSLLESTSPAVRMNEIRRLGNEFVTGAVPLIIQMLQDPSSGVRASAAVALGRFRSEGAVRPMLEVLKNDSSRSVRIMTAQALGSFSSEEVVEALSAAAEDEDELVAETAVRSLGRIGTPSTKERLMEKVRETKRERIKRASIESIIYHPEFGREDDELEVLEEIIENLARQGGAETAEAAREYSEKLREVRQERGRGRQR